MKMKNKILITLLSVISISSLAYATNSPQTIVHQTQVNTVSGNKTLAHRTIFLGTGSAENCHLTNSVSYGIYLIPKNVPLDGIDLAKKAGIKFTCAEEEYKTLTKQAIGQTFNLVNDGNVYTGASPAQDQVSI